MIDVREQIYEALTDVFQNVSMSMPERSLSLPLVVYSEITNTSPSMWREECDFQIDCYSVDFEDLMDDVQKADAIMTDIGFERTYTSPDTDARVEKDLYHKAMNYHGIIDTYHNRLIKESYIYG